MINFETLKVKLLVPYLVLKKLEIFGKCLKDNDSMVSDTFRNLIHNLLFNDSFSNQNFISVFSP